MKTFRDAVVFGPRILLSVSPLLAWLPLTNGPFLVSTVAPAPLRAREAARDLLSIIPEASGGAPKKYAGPAKVSAKRHSATRKVSLASDQDSN